MNWHNIGPFSAFFLENALFCGYALLAGVSSFAVNKLLKHEESSQNQNTQPVYFQRTLLNRSQQKISFMLLLLSFVCIISYQPASFTVNSLLSHFFDFKVFSLGSEIWESYIVFLVLPLCTFNFISCICSTVWLGKLTTRLKDEQILEKKTYKSFVFTVIFEWTGILIFTAALVFMMENYA